MEIKFGCLVIILCGNVILIYIGKQAKCFLGLTLFSRPGLLCKPKKRLDLKYRTRIKQVLNKHYDTIRSVMLYFIIS